MKKFSEYDRKGVADRLKQLRRAKGLTMDEASRLAGISFSQLSKLEVAQGNLGMDSLVRLADFYRTTKEWILTGEVYGETTGLTKAIRKSEEPHQTRPHQDIDVLADLLLDKETAAKIAQIAAAAECDLRTAAIKFIEINLEKKRKGSES